MVAHITFHGLVAVDLDCSVALGGRAPDASIKDFEWDEAKSEACFAERGFDFAYAARAFFDPDRLVMADNRYSYGEDRYQLIGKIERRLFVVVYTPCRNVIHIISARKANKKEVSHYENSTHED